MKQNLAVDFVLTVLGTQLMTEPGGGHCKMLLVLCIRQRFHKRFHYHIS